MDDAHPLPHNINVREGSDPSHLYDESNVDSCTIATNFNPNVMTPSSPPSCPLDPSTQQTIVLSSPTHHHEAITPMDTTSIHNNSKSHGMDVNVLFEHGEPSEVEMIKERFAKLLLGEDLSGGGKGVSTALAISNAITNVSASIFGELRQLEPLSNERKVRWRREMERLLSVSDYIIEYDASSKSLDDGSTIKVMEAKHRRDLHVYLPALKKLDTMLIETLDSFSDTSFWYTDPSISIGRMESDDVQSPNQSRVNRWWLPTPKVPSGGLSTEARKHLHHQRECVNQILKAALAVNAQTLSEMKVPLTYVDSLPKNGRLSLGETIYRTMRSEKFSATELISCMDPNQEHNIVDLMNSVEAALHIWKRKVRTIKQARTESKDGQLNKVLRGTFSKEGLIGLEKRQMLMERAESLLLLMRLKFPGMPQSILDVSKIQYCKDVGQSILESYSRVLESLAYNIRSRIEDVIYADEVAKLEQTSSLSRSMSKSESNYSTPSIPLFLSCSGRSLYDEHPHEPRSPSIP